MIDFIIRFDGPGSATFNFIPPEEPIFAEQLLGAAAVLDLYGRHMKVKQLESAEIESKKEKIVVARPSL